MLSNSIIQVLSSSPLVDRTFVEDLAHRLRHVREERALPGGDVLRQEAVQIALI